MDDIEIVAVIYEISIAYVIGVYLGGQKIHHRERAFISDIAHSLQTPLTVANAELELLRDEIIESESVTIIRKSLIRMSECIHRILRLARLEICTEQVWESIDLSALVQQEVEYVATMGEQHGVLVTMSIEPSIIFQGDRKSIIDVLINCSHNAIKYRRTSVVSKLHVALRKVGSCIELSFRDNGIGIDSKDVPYIFDRLYRASNHHEGFGLGLAFVKKIVDMHQGTIEVSSTLGEGTRFDIRLPASRI